MTCMDTRRYPRHYTRSDDMKFYEALKECIEHDVCITRADWNGKGQYVFFVHPNEDHEGYFVLHNAQGKNVVGWLATQTDLYSDVWMVVNTKPKEINHKFRVFK